MASGRDGNSASSISSRTQQEDMGWSLEELEIQEKTCFICYAEGVTMADQE